MNTFEKLGMVGVGILLLCAESLGEINFPGWAILALLGVVALLLSEGNRYDDKRQTEIRKAQREIGRSQYGAALRSVDANRSVQRCMQR
jgi:hypothetical protein